MHIVIYRVAGVLLVVALVSTGGSDPFARVPQNRRSPRPRLVVGGGGSSVAETQQHGHAAGTHSFEGDRPSYLSVTLATVTVAPPSLHIDASPALAELHGAGMVPELPGHPVSVAANTRPHRLPLVRLAARAPPV